MYECRESDQHRRRASVEGTAGLPDWPGPESLVPATKRTEVSHKFSPAVNDFHNSTDTLVQHLAGSRRYLRLTVSYNERERPRRPRDELKGGFGGAAQGEAKTSYGPAAHNCGQQELLLLSGHSDIIRR